MTRVAAEMRAKAETLRELHRKQARRYEDQLRARRAQLENMTGPLRDLLADVEEALINVDLYLGRDEQIKRLRDGDPADAFEAICVRQSVLAMDEECAADPDSGGMDSRTIEQFDEWLLEDPKHVDQVIPELKAVVVLVPRWQPKNSGDFHSDNAAAEANRRAYFLIRNGEKLYRTWTAFEAGGKVVVPTPTEFTGYFEEKVWDFDLGEYRRRPMRPGSDVWVRAEREAEARQRHFMRVALILQGLLDRTTVLYPLHPGGVGFTDLVHFREGRVRFILDAENTLTTGRTPFTEWLKERNALLRPGMRIVGAFGGEAWRNANTTYRERDRGWDSRHSRLHPATADAPESGRIYVIEERRPNGDLVVRYPRPPVYDRNHWVETRPGWGYRGGERPAKQRASVTLRPDDTFIIAFDHVSEAECVTYLAARGDRYSYVDMFPVLKAVIRGKREEAAAEAPFRVMMAGVLARENGVSVPDAEEAVPALVDWYKLANAHHRALVLGGEGGPLIDPATGDYAGAKVVRLIVAEHKRRLRDQQRAGAPELLGRLREMHPDALLIGRIRSGPYVVLVPENDNNVYTRRLEYSAAGELKSERRWWLPGVAQLRWIIDYQGDRWGDWDRAASAAKHLTDPERVDLVARARSLCKYPVLAVTENRKGQIEVWAVTTQARCDVAHLLTEAITAPNVTAMEVRWSRHNGHVRLDGLGSWSGYHWGKPRETAPWDGSPNSRDRQTGVAFWTVLWEDPAALVKLRTDIKYSAEQRAVGDRLNRVVEAAAWSIREGWERREHGKIHERFLADYDDESLWEGHCKANPLPTYHQGKGRSVITKALEALVEAGTLPWGMTVAEAVAAAQGDRYNWQGDHFDRTPAVAPADVADLVFTAPPPTDDRGSADRGDDSDDGPWDDDDA